MPTVLRFLREKLLVAIVGAAGVGAAGGYLAKEPSPVPITTATVETILACNGRGVDASMNPATGVVSCSDGR